MSIRTTLCAAAAFSLCWLAVHASDAQTAPSSAKDAGAKVESRTINVMAIIYDPVFKKHGNVKMSE